MSTKSLKERLRNTPAIPYGFTPLKQNVEIKDLGVGVGVKAFNLNAAPLENLTQSRRMEFREDAPGQGLLRTSIATRVRDTFEGAAVTALKSPDMEPSGSGGGLRPVSDYKLDCQRVIEKIRRAMPKHRFRLLEDFCYRDVFPWRGIKRKDERSVIMEIHRSLDEAGVALGMLSPESVKSRWARKPTSKPKAGPEPKPEA